MKPTIFLLSLFLNLNAQEITNQLEVNVFGLSYHMNRNVDYNEQNPGIGVGVILNSAGGEDDGFHASMSIQAGGYRDSFSDTAVYLVAGPRLTFGYEHASHATIELGMGYLHGSSSNGTVVIPVVSIGYDRFSLCATADLLGNNRNEDDEVSRAVAVFLRVKLFDF